MESDAVRHCEQTANALRRQNAVDLAAIFDALAAMERDHLERVVEWAADRKGAPVAEASPWPIPDTFDIPPEEIAQSSLMTPYRAFALAVRFEERSFAFWTYVAAHADGEVREAAERMAREQLEHVSLLRQERRKAFHANRRADKAEPVTFSDLSAAEHRVADLIDDRNAAPLQSATLGRLAEASREAAAKLNTLESVARPKFSIVGVPKDRESDVAAISEYLAEAYLRLAETSRNEQVLIVAQELATTAIDRLARVKALHMN
jgi:rubrerythrin